MRKLLSLGLLALFILFSSSVFAQTEDNPSETQSQSGKKPLSPEEQKIYDDFLERTQEFQDRPFDDPNLEFSVRLPKTWEKYETLNQGNAELTRRLLGIISRFSGPVMGDIHPEFIVEAVQLEHEITAEHWAKNFALTSGYTLKELLAKNDSEASGSYVSVENGTTFFIHFAAKISNGTMFFARFSVPLFAAEQLSNYMKLSIESFALAKSTGGPIENLKPFILRDVFGFKFPLSWELRYPRYDSDERVTIQLFNKSGDSEKLNGLITFIAIKKQQGITIESEVAHIRESIVKTQDVTFEEMLSSRIPPTYLRFNYALQEVYKIPAGKNHIAQEIWFNVYEDEYWYIVIYLLTPHRDETLYEWARNVRTLDIILRSLE